ncbi:CysZ protein [Catalinimonas alkaloidigena]|uniref:CysZ protein n=1 Tax=Catalinimonas alkaloidigena TaxID=1075417 RepID=A0A1G9N884_9BACT|nr:EI24 domain-containing protein [Catalinimonas alkaloidigena]SDL82583.1 CysZ protein [Catalinimonas alkaloidigena]
MTTVKDIRLGLRSYGTALAMIRQHRLWYFFLLPGVANLLLFALVFYFGWQVAYNTGQAAEGKFADWGATGGLAQSVGLLVSITLMLATLLLYFKLYKYLLLIVLAPLWAWIAERTQELDGAPAVPFSMRLFLKNLTRGLKIGLRSLVWEMLITGGLLLLLLVPFINLIVPLLLFLNEGFWWGFSVLDLRNEYFGWNDHSSVRWINYHKGLALSNGIVFLLLLAIPLLGLLVAPVLSVMAAGLAANRAEDASETMSREPGA